MESSTLVIVPQLRVKMRYQEWWPEVLESHLAPHFREVRVLGDTYCWPAPVGGFGCDRPALWNEHRQVEGYLELVSEWGVRNLVLLHCDLSYPGLFHSVLFYHRPGRAVAICHATSRNRFDRFAGVRVAKWGCEKAAAQLYQKVVVATNYHRKKLGWSNVVSLGALPTPPRTIVPPRRAVERDILLGSVARPTRQKVSGVVESELEKLTGRKVHRYRHRTWKAYYEFLDRVKFLVVTSREETYGYQIVDAVSRGCIPIAPRAFSYPELLPEHFLYPVTESAVKQACHIVRIAHEQKVGPDGVRLLNQKHIDRFWERLLEVLVS